MPRTKAGICRANRRTRREQGDGEEVGKAGYDIKEKEGKKKKQRRKNGGRMRADALLPTRCSEWYV